MAITQTKTDFTNHAIIEFLGSADGITVPSGWTGGIKVYDKNNTVNTITYTASGVKTLVEVKYFFENSIRNFANLSSAIEDVATFMLTQYSTKLSISTNLGQPFKLEVTNGATTVINSFLGFGFTWADSDSVRTSPDQSKIVSGWNIGERPKREWFNFFKNLEGNISKYVVSVIAMIKDKITSLESKIADNTTHIGFINTELDSVESRLGGAVLLQHIGTFTTTVNDSFNAYITYTGHLPFLIKCDVVVVIVQYILYRGLGLG